MFTNFKLILVTIVALSLIVIMQCSKSPNPTSQEEFNLLGKWEWVQSVSNSGIYNSHTILTPESEHKYRMYEFHDDSTYSVTEIINDGLNSKIDNYSGNYNITTDTSLVEIIHLAPSMSFMYKLDKDYLFLTELCCDNYKHIYVRVE